MSNYTTQTATLKATTIDTRKIDANQIDTKKLFINGELFDPSQIKESPNEATFYMIVQPNLEDNYDEIPGYWSFESEKAIWVDYGQDEQLWESLVYNGGELIKGSQTAGVLPNGVYVVIQIDDNFVKCIAGNSLNDADVRWLYNLTLAKFRILSTSTSTLEQCILENFIFFDPRGVYYWVVKVCEEEDDNLSELYGGISEEYPYFQFTISIPYYIPENDYTSSSSTYSLRNTNPFDSLREKFEQMRQQNS